MDTNRTDRIRLAASCSSWLGSSARTRPEKEAPPPVRDAGPLLPSECVQPGQLGGPRCLPPIRMSKAVERSSHPGEIRLLSVSRCCPVIGGAPARLPPLAA